MTGIVTQSAIWIASGFSMTWASTGVMPEVLTCVNMPSKPTHPDE